MALRFCDSYAHYNSVTDMTMKWASASNVGIQSSGPSARFGGNCLRIVSGTVYVNFDNQPTWIVGSAFYTVGITSGPILQIGDGANVQTDVRMNTDLSLTVTRNGTTLATSANKMSQNAWYYIEYKTLVGSSGTYQVNVNGFPWITGTGNTQATANAYGNRITLTYPSSTGYFCDTYVCDGTGSTNNTFLGDVRVDCLYPNAAGDLSQWTPTGSATNFGAVNETPENGDTSYVADSTVGDYDIYKYGALPTTPVTIFGLQTNLWARKDDAGTRQIASVVRVGGTNYDGATKTLGATYQDYMEIRETNPATSAAWTAANLASGTFQAGVKVIS